MNKELHEELMKAYEKEYGEVPEHLKDPEGMADLMDSVRVRGKLEGWEKP